MLDLASRRSAGLAEFDAGNTGATLQAMFLRSRHLAHGRFYYLGTLLFPLDSIGTLVRHIVAHATHMELYKTHVPRFAPSLHSPRRSQL